MKKNSSKMAKKMDLFVEEAEKIPENNDEAQTELIRACDEENLAKMVEAASKGYQDAPGVLNELHADRFNVTARAIEEIPIGNLQRFEEIADFVDPSDTARPIVVRTPSGDFVVDGWHYISNAIASGVTSIECEVDVIGTHSVMELCFIKAGIRSLTRGGRPRYAEQVRNTVKIERQLLSENESIVTYGHGGRRFGEEFSGVDRGKDVVTLLGLRFGKNRDTINGYRNHGEHISDDVMTVLINNNWDKKRFEKFGTLKRKLLQQMDEEGRTPDEKTAEISALARQCAEGGGPELPNIPPQAQTRPDPNEQDGPEEAPPEGDGDDPQDGEEDEVPEEDLGDEYTPEPDQPEEDPIRTIKRSTLEVSVRLSQRIETSIDATSLYDALIEEIRELNAMVARIAGLTNPGNRQEREAA